jgi:hypothetical protein
MEGKIPMNALSTGYIYKYWNKTFVPQILDQKSYVKKKYLQFYENTFDSLPVLKYNQVSPRVIVL